jgi:hypothetical protein
MKYAAGYPRRRQRAVTATVSFTLPPDHAVEIGIGGEVLVVHERDVVVDGALGVHVGEAQPEQIDRGNGEEEHEQYHGGGEEAGHR